MLYARVFSFLLINLHSLSSKLRNYVSESSYLTAGLLVYHYTCVWRRQLTASTAATGVR